VLVQEVEIHGVHTAPRARPPAECEARLRLRNLATLAALQATVSQWLDS
jgi:hypothetical protein